MPTFQFDDGLVSLTSMGSTAGIVVSDDAVSFRFSTSGNPGPNTQITHSPSVGSGQFAILDTQAATWVFDVFATTGSLTNFDGSGLQLQFGSLVTGTWNVVFVDENGLSNVTVAMPASFQTITLGPTSTNFSEIRFVPVSSSGTFTLDSLTTTIVCYLEDTGIDTPEGRVAVQDLREGDRICLADGGETTVKWVGVQPVDTRTAHPAKVNPICITAGAIADNVPERDLFVSPDHAIEIDGRLYNASALVNGASIYKVAQMPQAGFTYYHIETEAHEVILAEGCPAESYLDMPDRTAFVNGSERADAARIAEMPLPRIVAKRMVPADVADRLAARIKHRTAA